MKNLTLKSLLVIALLLFHISASAEDIDLFVGAPPAASDIPNVLIIMDNTANWSSAFTNERAAVVSAVSALPVNQYRVGLMMFTETGGANTGNAGGYIRAAVRTLSSATQTKFLALLNSLDSTADRTSGGKAALSLMEAYRYFSGGAPYAGNNKVKVDYISNTSGGTAASNAIYALAGNALSSVASTTYLSPVVGGSCAKNFIIYISNGPAQDNSSDTTTATTALSSAGGSTTTIPLSPSGSQTNMADEWAKFMRTSGSPVISTITMEVDKGTTGQSPGWTALMKSIAGDPKNYFDVSSTTGGGTQIKEALDDIFSAILASNSVFASVSLPVSANLQNVYLNQIFIGMFRPTSDASPRWNGNLKQYKAGYDVNGLLTTADADGNDAISSDTGFVDKCARSFWTPTVVDTYWTFKQQGGCTKLWNSATLSYVTTAGLDASNAPDGNIVEKGAQAYQLRSTTTRTVKTCSSVFATCASTAILTNFDNTTVTQAMLGAASTTERDTLINWARGLDVAAASGVDGDENSNGVYYPTATTNEMRPSVHGDVVHSRPVAIDYGPTGSHNVVVFYGANDGMLRAINGNRTSTYAGTNAGMELWAFMPPEFYSNIKRIRDNTTEINFPGNLTTSPRPQPKPYGMDGPVTAFKDATRTWIYSTMRRGGRIVYAFDVTTPASPTLKWKIGCPNAGDDTGCTSGFTSIGQTWSSPKVLQSSGYGSGLSPMLIMGGGYDSCEDADPNTCTSASKGNKIYVLNADTGALLHTMNTDRSVVGDVFIVQDSASLAIYAYATDLGGNIYRITIGSAAPASWTLTKIASLGCPTTASCTANRKFMFHPDVLDDNGTYVLLVGSGDREKPLGISTYPSASSVTNYFFMVKDKPTDGTWLSSENTTCGANIICLNSLLPIPLGAASPTQAEIDAKKGWYLGLNPTEQVVTSALTLYNVVNFSTHQPQVTTPGVCNALGKTLLYKINYANAAPSNGTTTRSQTVLGGGLPPSPVAGTLILDDGTQISFCMGCDPKSPLKLTPPPPPASAAQPKSRVYWYIQK